MDKTKHIVIIGLSYVGLPLAIEFWEKYKVLGFDINQERVKELQVNTVVFDTKACIDRSLVDGRL